MKPGGRPVLSFRKFRIICFGALILLNICGGIFFYMLLQDIASTMSQPILAERPYLNQIIHLQQATIELDLHLHKQISGELIDNSSSLAHIDRIIPAVEILKEKPSIATEELNLLKEFKTSLKRLRLGLIYYKENKINDASSSSTEELYDIINENIHSMNQTLNSIISLTRLKIADSDVKVLEGTQFIQNGLLYFLLTMVIGTLSILFIFNRILSSNLRNLVNGTVQLGQGNLDWRISNPDNDEFGQLSGAFNEMAGNLSAMHQKIVSQAEEIKHLAYYDSLTKLPNRLVFLDKLNQELALAERRKEAVAVLYIDLDDFKLVNDSYGHDIGDFLLVEVAQRLRLISRRSDTVARLSGDEFAIILPYANASKHPADTAKDDLGDIADPGVLSQRIIAALSRPVDVSGNVHNVGCSIGIAIYPDNGLNAGEILKSADTAMYAAKKEGKNRFKYCTEAMTAHILRVIETEREIREALDNDHFILHFQPQIDLTTKQIVGLEALIRWNCPTRGMIPPAEFIPVAEERGVIQDISKWVVQAVFRQLRVWHEAGLLLVPVMTNLSARNFHLQEIPDYIERMIETNQDLKNYFGVEVTETAIMEDRDNAVAILQRLKDMGVMIALDDFGTGYSSMNYLKFLPIDTVKIDRSFVKNIAKDRKNAAITKAIIAMAHALDLKVLAEGVEDSEQHVFLVGAHCDLAQGYHFHRPLAGDTVRELLDLRPKTAASQ